MMRKRLMYAYNIGLFLVATILLMVFQTTVWYHLFDTVAGPNFWLPAFVYLGLFRKPVESILTGYLLALAVSANSGIPLGIAMLCGASITSVAFAIRQRIHWSGVTYFMMSTLIAVFVFHLSHLILSWVFEPNKLSSPRILYWLGQLVTTPLISPFLYRLFSWIDKITEKEAVPEPGLI